MARKERERTLGKFLGLHVGQRFVVQHVVVASRAQQLQEVDSALAAGAREVGEQLVADVSAVAVLPWWRAPVSSTWT